MPYLRQFARTVVSEPLLGRGLALVRFPGVAILCYHAVLPDDTREVIPFAGLHVTASQFADHCRALSRYCSPISLDAWRHHRQHGQALPPRPVLVTFDDGYRSVFTVALPILKEFAVPAAVFVCTEPVERGEMFWYDALALSTDEPTVIALKDASYEDWSRSVSAHRRRADVGAVCAPLTPADVRTLACEPLIEVGGHSHTHPILGRAAAEVQKREIDANLGALEQWTGRRARAFAYPNGRPDVDFDATTQNLLTAAGIEDAFSTEERIAHIGGDRLSQPRFVITSGLTAEALLYRLGWVWR